MKALLIVLFLVSTTWASEPDVDFNKKWSYTKLMVKKDLKAKYSTKLFKRYLNLGKKHWPISEVIYTQHAGSKKKINLNIIINKKIKIFDSVKWTKDKQNGVLIKRGFWKKGNRYVEVHSWKRPQNGYGVLLSLTRRAYFKTVNKELIFIQETLQNPKSKITSAFNLIINSAYAQDSLAGANQIFSDTLITSAMETGLIPVLTVEGGTTFITEEEATQVQLQLFNDEKKKFEEKMREEETNLRDQKKEIRRIQKELEAQEEEEEKQRIEREEAARELAEIEAAIQRQEELLANYKIYDEKINTEKIKIFELENLADEILMILEEIESQNDPSATIEDMIMKYSAITGRDANFDCVDCVQTQMIEFNTGSINRMLNFLHEARLKGRDPKMEFCKKYEAIIRSLINLEHFNQEARAIILLAENEVYGQLLEQMDESADRYAQLNSADHEKERQALLKNMHGRVNRADKEWMRNNRKPFLADCQTATESGHDKDADPLMRSSYELAMEIVESRNPIDSGEDFLWQFFCWGQRCQLKKACKQIYKESLNPPMESQQRDDAELAQHSTLIRQQVADAEQYFNDIRDQMECYSRLMITFDPQDFSKARHMTDPSAIPQCSKKGAEDAVRLYNLKKKLLHTFNEQECPQKMDDFYQGMANIGQRPIEN